MLQMKTMQESLLTVMRHIPSTLQNFEEELKECGRLILIHQLIQKGCSPIAYQLLFREARRHIRIYPPISISSFLQSMINNAINCVEDFSESRLKSLASELCENTFELVYESQQSPVICMSLILRFKQSWLDFTEEYLKAQIKQE